MSHGSKGKKTVTSKSVTEQAALQTQSRVVRGLDARRAVIGIRNRLDESHRRRCEVCSARVDCPEPGAPTYARFVGAFEEIRKFADDVVLELVLVRRRPAARRRRRALLGRLPRLSLHEGHHGRARVAESQLERVS